MNYISLSELNSRVQETIRLNFDLPVWIHAEISELRENFNGHCYLELTEKDAESDNLIAKTKAVIWSATYRMLKPYFETSTGQTLRSGLEVLIAVTVEFHSVYGFSLNIRDIDPTYTIGEMAARRIKIIRQLEEDGIVDMNKSQILGAIPQRLAVISSPTAAGYDDFINQLKLNNNGFKFYTRLFTAIMQGESAENSIITALEKIYNNIHLFDAVVLIRGGGATTDLSCFDSYSLALNIAQFPLPVITGIGHQRDNTVIDMIAHTSVKTPTAAAEFFIDKLTDSYNLANNLWLNIHNLISEKIQTERHKLENLKWKIKQSLQIKKTGKSTELIKYQARITTVVKLIFSKHQRRLLLLEKSIEAHSPAFLIKHGYSITTFNGKRINSISEVKTGNIIRTILPDGTLESEVIE